MALTKVGSSPAVMVASIAEGGTLTVTFTPDTTFATNDLLVCFVASGAKTAGSTYTHLPGTADTPNGYTTGWHVPDYHNVDVCWANGPHFGLTYHYVTAGEAGASPVVLTVTLGDTSTVGGSTGYIIASGGVAVRGSDSVHGVLTNGPDNLDHVLYADGSFGGSPWSLTLDAYTPVTDYIAVAPTAGYLLFYLVTSDGALFQNSTAFSTVFTDQTELDDDFYQNSIATTFDIWVASAYNLIGPSDALSAEGLVVTGTNFSQATRTIVALDLSTPSGTTVAAVQEWVPHRVDIGELPYSVHTGMLG